MAKGHRHLLWLTVFGLLFVLYPNVCCSEPETALCLSEDERAALHLIARTTVDRAVRGEKIPSFSISSDRLEEHRGAFVTLKKGGQLRGCVGCLVGRMPLCETVQKMAVHAATLDPRFPPLSLHELPSIEIEISVLSLLKRVERIEDIVVGTHGLVLVYGNRSGVLLPQVAVENGWDRKALLEGVSWKAGLPKDTWKSPDSRIFIFTAEVF